MPNSLIVLVDEIVAVLEVLPFADGVMVRLDRSELRLRFACVDDSGDICTQMTVSEKQANDPRTHRHAGHLGLENSYILHDKIFP